MKKKGFIAWLAYTLVLIGAINWGIVGALGINIISSVLQSLPVLLSILYIAVGVSAFVVLYRLIEE